MRYSELLKQQAKLVRDLDTAISRRDTIVTRGEIAQKNPNVVTRGKVQRDVVEIQKKIKETGQEISKLEAEIRLAKDKQQQLASVLEDKQKAVQNLHEQVESRESYCQDLLRQKQEVSAHIPSLSSS